MACLAFRVVFCLGKRYVKKRAIKQATSAASGKGGKSVKPSSGRRRPPTKPKVRSLATRRARRHFRHRLARPG